MAIWDGENRESTRVRCVFLCMQIGRSSLTEVWALLKPPTRSFQLLKLYFNTMTVASHYISNSFYKKIKNRISIPVRKNYSHGDTPILITQFQFKIQEAFSTLDVVTLKKALVIISLFLAPALPIGSLCQVLASAMVSK